MTYTKPIYKIVDKRVILLEDWVTPYGTIPATSDSDGVSRPGIVAGIIHRFGELLEASIAHDYWYDNAIKNKAFADKAFYKLAIDSGANKYKAKIAYWAVKFFGKGNY